MGDRDARRARERYFKAATKLSQHLLEHEGTGANDSTKATMRREEAEAFANYCRILATHTELVAMGKLPPERPNEFDIPRNSD